jgi:pyruvate/2-oxoglutarate/acetoin dehydrogenase E1 component/TPP-dependent pyruvate/acetoin dehydrogenase alpha subunit
MIDTELALQMGPLTLDRDTVLHDYQLAVMSRQCSLLVRKEVFSGRAKFGIYGDGKELCQIALARAAKPGDFVAGYYRDQTIVAFLKDMTWTQYFSQLYGHPDIAFDPHTGGRTMNNHHATRWLDEQGKWRSQTELFNSMAGLSSTAGQMPHGLGAAYASKIYRQVDELASMTQFSNKGNEVCFATIGDASTSEGMFLETVNAAGVLQVPLVMSVWDDGYGISVPSQYQTTKSSISKALAGYQRNANEPGLEVIAVKAWDYVGLINAYRKAAELAREHHIPSLIHVEEVTQQQGHSSSGSHERYKSAERLQFEIDYDCNTHFRAWIVAQGLATETELAEIDEAAAKQARQCQKDAWNAYQESLSVDREAALVAIQQAARESRQKDELLELLQELKKTPNPTHRDAMSTVKRAIRLLRVEGGQAKRILQEWLQKAQENNAHRFNSFTHSQSPDSPLKVTVVPAQYETDAVEVDGREILNQFFDHKFKEDPRVFILGEDVGKIGDVNQTLNGLQAKYGEIRVTDTGIREMTIVGQGIGSAMRGLRPIVEIQYLDYIYYALAVLTDDLACLHYRTVGGQKAPLIVRTRGHRLEGIWHSGSPMAALIHSLRGMHLCVPRNMTQAAGMYQTLLLGDDPAVVIECLNGYRLKEKQPSNVGQMAVPLGVPECLRTGRDLTIVTYGSMCRIVLEAAQQLDAVGISVEVMDVQTLLPFDTSHRLVESIKKTNRVIFADEDMPGGASAYMMQEVLQNQNAYAYLDAKPICVAAQPHRPPYSSDGDYFSKPNVETIFDAAYELMHEAAPDRFPKLY